MHKQTQKVSVHTSYVLKAHCSGLFVMMKIIVVLLYITREPTFQFLSIFFVETFVFSKSNEVSSLKGPSVLVGE